MLDTLRKQLEKRGVSYTKWWWWWLALLLSLVQVLVGKAMVL